MGRYSRIFRGPEKMPARASAQHTRAALSLLPGHPPTRAWSPYAHPTRAPRAYPGYPATHPTDSRFLLILNQFSGPLTPATD